MVINRDMIKAVADVCLRNIALVVVVCLFALDSAPKHQAEARRRVVNPYLFEYNRNTENHCIEKHTELLLAVHSLPTNFRQRSIIRETWGNPNQFKNHNTSLVFFLGTSKNKTIQSMVAYESDVYRDIVQVTFIDGNNTLAHIHKDISSCKWISTYCTSVTTVLKANDDVVVDIYLLIKHFDSLRSSRSALANTFLCDVHNQRGQVNESTFTSLTDFDLPYCLNSGYVMTGDLPEKLYLESFYYDVPLFHQQHVYFTGLLAKSVGVQFDQLFSVHRGTSQRIRNELEYLNADDSLWVFYIVSDIPIYRMLWDMIRERELHRIEKGIISVL